MAQKSYRLGNGRRACDLRVGNEILIAGPADQTSGYHAAKTLRDSIRVTIKHVSVVRLYDRKAYVFECSDHYGIGTYTTRPLYGINVVFAPVPRTAVRTLAPREKGSPQ